MGGRCLLLRERRGRNGRETYSSTILTVNTKTVMLSRTHGAGESNQGALSWAGWREDRPDDVEDFTWFVQSTAVAMMELSPTCRRACSTTWAHLLPSSHAAKPDVDAHRTSASHGRMLPFTHKAPMIQVHDPGSRPSKFYHGQADRTSTSHS